MFRQHVDATLHSAIGVCSCGWRYLGSTRGEAWHALDGHTHQQAADHSTDQTSLQAKRHPRGKAS